MTNQPTVGPRHAAAPRARRRPAGGGPFRPLGSLFGGQATWLVGGVIVLALGWAGVAAAGVMSEPSTVIIENAPGARGVPAPDSDPGADSVPMRPLAVGRSVRPVPVPVASAHVRYELVGPPLADFVTFTTGQPGVVQPRAPLQLPWRTEFDASGGFIPTITAQNAGDGAISCRITVNGSVVSDVTSDGAYGVATCTGNVIAAR